MRFNPNKHTINHGRIHVSTLYPTTMLVHMISFISIIVIMILNRKDRNTYGATGAAPLALRLSPMSKHPVDTVIEHGS